VGLGTPKSKTGPERPTCHGIDDKGKGPVSAQLKAAPQRRCFCSSERLASTGINARARTTNSAGSGTIVRTLFDPSIVPRPARAAWSERIAKNQDADSLFFKKFSLIRVQKFPVPLRREFSWKPLNSRADWTSKSQRRAGFCKIPVNFPVSWEFGAETGSHLTAMYRPSDISRKDCFSSWLQKSRLALDSKKMSSISPRWLEPHQRSRYGCGPE
jgi:hypothetical protein